MRRRTTAVISTLALPAVAVSAYVQAPITFQVASATGECAVSWQAPGVTFQAQIPARNTAGPGMAFTGGSGQLNVNADVLPSDPAALAKVITMDVGATGGFTLQDRRGGKVEVSDLDAVLPLGDATFTVRSTAHPDRTRIPVVTDTSSTLDPKLTRIVPPQLAVHLTGLRAVITPEFAQVLNETFGPGTAKSGDAFGVCNGDVTTA
ncbi:hypothetical protein ABZ769_24785 [Streptomyces olivoreticuli]